MTPANSIEIAIWAAVGGRGDADRADHRRLRRQRRQELVHRQACPEYWLYFLGALFIAVTLFLPHGMVGLVNRKCARGGRNDAGSCMRRMATERRSRGLPAAAPPRGKTESGGRAASYSRIVEPGELDVAHGRDPVSGRHQRQLRRLQGDQRAVAGHRAGELRCIIGPNGAGKTTMMDIITGKTRPDSRHGVLRQRPSTCCATREAEIAQRASGASSRSRRCSSSSRCSRTSSSR